MRYFDLKNDSLSPDAWVLQQDVRTSVSRFPVRQDDIVPDVFEHSCEKATVVTLLIIIEADRFHEVFRENFSHLFPVAVQDAII